MAGIFFYSLEEVAEKLKITEDQVKQIVQQGKLREFRNGPDLLFKVDEVESLVADAASMSEDMSDTQPQEVPSEQQADESEILLTDSSDAQEPPQEIPSEQQADESEISLADSSDGSVFGSDLTNADTTVASDDLNVLGGTESAFAITDDTMADTIAANSDTAQPAEPDGFSLASSEEDLLLDDDGSLSESQGRSLSSFGDESLPSLGGESLSSLGEESLSSFSEDSSIKGIDDDVNLDSFGSGSGLLDLSLQADDTSLGGILDEIYTPDTAGQQADMPLVDASSEMNAEADQMLGEDGFGAPAPAEMVSAMPRSGYAEYAEPVPDSISNAFGYMMFLPLLAIVYTGIVGVAGHMGLRPAILEKVQPIIWYVMGGAAILAILMVAVPVMLAAGPAKTAKKAAPKAKKQKLEKPKKPKKLKKQKKAK